MTKIPPLTEKERASWPAHGIVKLEKPFVDVRGKIQPLVDEMMRSAVLIESKAGSIRANHFHKTDWHYCYVLNGKIAYYHRRHGIKTKPKKIIINEGELFFTPPMVDHAMKFLSYTEFLTLGRGSRSKINYDKDTHKIILI